MSQKKHLLLIRMSGDIGTKAEKTRNHFITRLVRNIKDALKSNGFTFHIRRTRIRLYVAIDDVAAVEILSKIFGIQAIARARSIVFKELEDIVAAGLELHKDEVAGKTFAIRSKRSGARDKIPFTSSEVAIKLGRALLDHSAGVDLDNPDVELRVEIHPRQAYFFTNEVPGPAGLPLNASGRALALMSGGYDSPVASWLILSRGVNLDYVFFNLGGKTHRRDVLQVLDVIASRWSYGTRPRLYEVDLRPMVDHLREVVRERYWQVILKRLMMRGAAMITSQVPYGALMTGEALAQVSSQTLQNLSVIDRATQMLILRPLIGYGKNQIIKHSQVIGTHDISAHAQEYCALTPSKPSTNMKLERALTQEAGLDMSRLEEAVENATVYNLRDLDLSQVDLDTPTIEEVPDGATVVDLRDARSFASWHYPEAIHRDYFKALRAFEKWDRDQTYVLCCEVGLKSAGLADLMRRRGFDAYNFRGGVPRLVKYAAEESDPLLAELLSPVVLD